MIDYLEHKELIKILSYNKKTGLFKWLIKPCRNIRKGKVAGYHRSDGRRKIMIHGVKYYASRLAWFYVYGQWPENEIDHINGIRSDDRITNLRDVNTKINRENRHSSDRDNKTGFLGVTIIPSGRYGAQIGNNKKTLRLGTYDTPEQAHQAYLEAKRKLHLGCTI